MLILKKTGAKVDPYVFVDHAINHIVSFHKLVDSGEENPLNFTTIGFLVHLWISGYHGIMPL